MVNEAVIKVLTTQVGVTSSGLDLEDTLFDGEERHIESTTAQVEDQNIAFTISFLVETVSNSSRSGLVNDTEDIEAGNKTSILGSLTLGVVEVGGDGDDGIVDSAAKIRLRSLSHLGEDHGGDLLRSELLGLTLELDLNDRLTALVGDLEGEVFHVSLDLRVGELTTNESLCVEDCVGGVHGDLVLRGITDEALCVCESNERGCGSVTLVVGNDFDTVITEDTHAGVGGTQIDTCCKPT